MLITPPPCCCHLRTLARTEFVSCIPSGCPISSGFVGVDLALPPRLEGRCGVAGDGIEICAGKARSIPLSYLELCRMLLIPGRYAGTRDMFVDTFELGREGLTTLTQRAGHDQRSEQLSICFFFVSLRQSLQDKGRRPREGDVNK